MKEHEDEDGEETDSDVAPGDTSSTRVYIRRIFSNPGCNNFILL